MSRFSIFLYALLAFFGEGGISSLCATDPLLLFDSEDFQKQTAPPLSLPLFISLFDKEKATDFPILDPEGENVSKKKLPVARSLFPIFDAQERVPQQREISTINTYKRKRLGADLTFNHKEDNLLQPHTASDEEPSLLQALDPKEYGFSPNKQKRLQVWVERKKFGAKKEVLEKEINDLKKEINKLKKKNQKKKNKRKRKSYEKKEDKFLKKIQKNEKEIHRINTANLLEVSVALGFQRSLLRSPQKEETQILTLFLTQEELGSLPKKEWPQVAKRICEARVGKKQIYDLSIINQGIVADVREALGMTRKDFTETRDLFVSVPAPAFVPPVPIETKEEKRAQKLMEQELMQKLDLAQGIDISQLNQAVDREQKGVAPYLAYFNEKKSLVLQKKALKIRPAEVIECYHKLALGIPGPGKSSKPSYDLKKEKRVSFSEKVNTYFYPSNTPVKDLGGQAQKCQLFPSKFIGRLKIEGYILDFDIGIIDLRKVDAGGESNLTRMQEGRCPMGPDGEPLNFHHINHYDFRTHKPEGGCYIRVLSNSFHETKSGGLHFAKSVFYFPKNPINRQAFNDWRQKKAIPALRSVLENGQALLKKLCEREPLNSQEN